MSYQEHRKGRGYQVITNDKRNGDARNPTCDGKKKYDKRGAIGAAKKVHLSGREKAMRVYPCDHCGGWHIAHARTNWKKFRD